jgi:hypothetical protein
LTFAPLNWPPQGRLAQLGEHQLDKLGVTGSSPVPPTELGSTGTAGARTATSARERAALHPQGHSLRDCLRQRHKAAQKVARRLGVEPVRLVGRSADGVPGDSERHLEIAVHTTEEVGPTGVPEAGAAAAG